MKIYKVPLYRVSCNDFNYGRVDIVNKSDFLNNILYSYLTNKDKHLKEGIHLITFRDDFSSKNEVNSMDINRYVSSYDDSIWKKIYEDIIITNDKKRR